jgi:hypothetical protein
MLRTLNSKYRTPNDALPAVSLDDALLQVESSSLKKVLFGGQGVEEISSYVTGWMGSHGMDVIVLDGANRFNPYIVSSFARTVLIPPEVLLKKIRIARAFTCYQMATLMGEKLARLIRQERTIIQAPRPWVILLGPITTFLDEDVPEREAGPLFERALRQVELLAGEGIPFLLFQPFIPSRSRRAYLMKRLFQFAHLVLKIHVDGEGPKVTLEKGRIENNLQHRCPTDESEISVSKKLKLPCYIPLLPQKGGQGDIGDHTF